MTSRLPSREFRGFDQPLLILLIERDDETRRAYAEFLRQMGSDVEEAEDGREGLAKALARRPDAIVTGTRLSGINGYDLCRVLRHDLATATLPIIVIAGELAETEVRRAVHAGATSVLTGRCSAERLAGEIQQALDIPSPDSRDHAPNALAQLTPIEDEGDQPRRRLMLNHTHGRGMTTDPATPAPKLTCPNCFQPLQYLKSFLGGVSARHPEQWDYFECQTGCGTFQYRHRTRKLRQIS